MSVMITSFEEGSEPNEENLIAELNYYKKLKNACIDWYRILVAFY